MKGFQRLSALVLILVMLLLTVPISVPAASAAEPPDEPSPFTDYYCREALKALPNATALLYAYDQMVAGVEVSLTEISVYDGVNPISYEELEVAMDAYRRDHAEHFWLGTAFSVSYDATTVYKVRPTYTLSGDALTGAKVQFEEAITRMLADVTPTMNEFERERILHDSLAAKVTYVEGSHAHDAYGALVQGEAVCEGYAEALQVLCHRAGLQSLLVMGSSINPSTNQPEGHAWNMVRIDGKYYHVDLTWNDQGATLYHAYFNLTDALIREDHTVTETAYALPTCNTDDAHYFTVMGGKITEYTDASIGTLLRENDLSASLYLTGDKATFLSWYSNNIRAIATQAGVNGAFTYGYVSLGREVILMIETCRHTSLTPVTSTPADCTTDGNSAYFICTCGKWFSDAAATEEIRNHDSVRIPTSGHDWSEKLADNAHLRSTAADCRTSDTYWHDCANCNEISTNAYWSSEQYGAHDYKTEWSSDTDGHFHACRYCDDERDRSSHVPGEEATETTPQICTECQYVLTPALSQSAQGEEPDTTDDAWKLPIEKDQLILYGAIGGGGILLLVILIAIIKKCR